MSLEAVIIDYIEGRRDNLVMKGVLFFCSLCFQMACRIRHFGYDLGILRSYSVDALVISVGNIVAGGTGKTPFVKMLVDKLIQEGLSTAVVSRGYRSNKNKKNAMYQVSQGQGPIVSVDISGDEAFWLAKETKACIWVGKDRVASAKRAVACGAKIIVVEDGMQHRRLRRNIEIVLLHGADPFGGGYFLPRGYLRDLPQRLQKADYIVITHIDEIEDQLSIQTQIRKFSDAPIIGFSTDYRLPENSLAEKMGAFCGIAKPGFFYKALQRLGVQVVKSFFSEDHVLPSIEELTRFAESCKTLGARYLVCTEKDAVKLNIDEVAGLPIIILKMEFTCAWNETIWQQLCQSIRVKNNDRRI